MATHPTPRFSVVNQGSQGESTHLQLYCAGLTDAQVVIMTGRLGVNSYVFEQIKQKAARIGKGNIVKGPSSLEATLSGAISLSRAESNII